MINPSCSAALHKVETVRRNVRRALIHALAHASSETLSPENGNRLPDFMKRLHSMIPNAFYDQDTAPWVLWAVLLRLTFMPAQAALLLATPTTAAQGAFVKLSLKGNKCYYKNRHQLHFYGDDTCKAGIPVVAPGIYALAHANSGTLSPENGHNSRNNCLT